MKKTVYTLFIMMISLFSTQSYADDQTPLASTIKQQFATALAQQNQPQLEELTPQFVKQASISPNLLEQQIKTTEKILTRIFKTDKNLTPKFIHYLYFEPVESIDTALLNEMKKNLLVSYLANENSKIYIKQSSNSAEFVQILQQKGAKESQIFVLNETPKGILEKIVAQIQQDFPNQTRFNITENRVNIIAPSSEIKPRLALANAIFDKQFKGVEVDDFSYLNQPRENLQHNNVATRYKTFQAMLEGLE